MADWREILANAIAKDPRGKAGVADRMGVSRAYVSRATSTGSSTLAEVPQRFIDRVLELEADIACPARGTCVPRGECHKANQPAPTHNPQAMRHWRECQTCQHKPAKETAHASS